MWRAVICRAIEDAENGSRPALLWLYCENDDFRTVCDLAAICPDALRDELTRGMYKKNK